MELPFEQDMVHDAAAVVDRDVAQHLDRAGLRVDLDLRNVRAARKRRRGRNAAQRVERRSVAAHDLLERDREVGASHTVFPRGKFQIFPGDLELLRREIETLFHHLARRRGERGAVRSRRARADRAAAGERRPGRVARAQDDVAGVDAEDLRHDLGIHRFMPLPRRAGEHVERGVARIAELDRRLLLGDGPAARGLDEHRAADAAQSPPFQGSLAPLLERAPFGLKERLLELAGRVAAVVGRGRGLVGERRLRNQVAPTQLDAVDAGLARRLVDQPLHQIGNARPPRAAVGRRRRGVGEREPVAAIEGGDAVGVRRMRGRIEAVDQRPRLRQVGAHVADPAHAQREKPALAVERELAVQLYAAAVMIAHQGLEAGADPFHRLAERSCGEHQRAVLRVGLRTDAEAAADVAVVQADPVERRAGDDSEVGPHHRHALRRRVNVEAAGRGFVRDHAGLGLDGVARDSGRLELQAGDVRGARERLLRRLFIPVLVVEAQVSRDIVVQQGRAGLERFLRVDHGGQLAILDVEPLGSVLRRGRRSGDDERYFLAHVAHAAAREDVAVRDLEHRSAAPRKLDHRRRRLESRRVLARENGDHAATFQCIFFC